MSISRRQFLTYVGVGSYGLLRNPSMADALRTTKRPAGKPPAFFQPIQPSLEDKLIVPNGYQAQVVLSWGDDLGTNHAKYGAEKFGFNNDFIAYFPMDALSGGKNSQEGLLWVNHEYPNPMFVSGYDDKGKKTPEQIIAEKLSVGGSVIHVKKENNKWKLVSGSKYNRRFTALYPEVPLSGPTANSVPHGIGTLANCSGGRTPWFTALSCEENYPDYNQANGYHWTDIPEHGLKEEQYGWIVEIDPFGELPPMKHSALGRFKHENAAVVIGSTGKVVVYMGDDEADQYLYKFVSSGQYDPKASRKDNQKLLSEGILYVAEFSKGQWLPLDKTRNSKLPDDKFPTQGDVLLKTREAAKALGATPLDRCEDCEVHPDGSIYVALTNNTKHGNYFGQIVRLIEKNDNHESEQFEYEIFLAGGPRTGLACPDNLAFDKQGNLWVFCDMASDMAGKDVYKSFGNNGVFVVPTFGPSAGEAFQFASGPKECEITGPWFTEDSSTLWMSIQHPGENSKDSNNLTSHWPDGGTSIPKPSIVAISGFGW